MRVKKKLELKKLEGRKNIRREASLDGFVHALSKLAKLFFFFFANTDKWIV